MPPIQVEARSLAALNNLASNPPQYPRNPAHGRQEPLTLYISRVPGTKDVILSTFRPGLKSVTAEDIASSLYYVHHEAPASAVQHRPRQLSDVQSTHRPSFESALADPNATTHKPIRRKPVPSSGATSPVADGVSFASSPPPLQIPSSPSSQLDVHPLLRTPVAEQALSPTNLNLASPPTNLNTASPSTNLKPSPSFSAYRPGAGLPSPPQTLSTSGLSPTYERSLSPTITQYENRSLSPTRNYLAQGPQSDTRLENALHLGSLAPSRPPDGSFRAYSPLHSATPSPQPSGGNSPSEQRSLDKSVSTLGSMNPVVRTPSPPKVGGNTAPQSAFDNIRPQNAPENVIPTRTQSKASEHPALPSSRRALATSPPASPSNEYSAVFQALDEFEPAPPVPPKHPRRMSEHNIPDNNNFLDVVSAARPVTPADTPTQPPLQPRSPPPGYSPGSFVHHPPTEKPTRQSVERSTHTHTPSSGPNLLPTSNPPPIEHGRRSLDARLGHLTPPPPSHSPNRSHQGHSHSNHLGLPNHHPHHGHSNSGHFAPPPGNFTLALIRREPSSGQQWNIGRISALFRNPDADDEQAAPPLLHIHVDTLGYTKFTNPISYRQYAGMDPRQTMSTTTDQPIHSPTPSELRMGPPAFQREVRASYGKRWRSNIKTFFRRSHHAGMPGSGLHGRRNSDDSAGSLDGDGHPHTSRDTKLRGYEFDSPWGGRCEFRTAEGGRNLRCQHHLPLEGVAPIPGQEGSAQMSRDPVSELRFNLPRHHHPRSKSSSDVPTLSGASESLTGHFSRLMQRDDDEEDDWDDADGLGMVSPFELNLGREKAGGGHHGKRAKMGKLIVYDAGLKMLDLVVAANVGLWWRLWDVGK